MTIRRFKACLNGTLLTGSPLQFTGSLWFVGLFSLGFSNSAFSVCFRLQRLSTWHTKLCFCHLWERVIPKVLLPLIMALKAENSIPFFNSRSFSFPSIIFQEILRNSIEQKSLTFVGTAISNNINSNFRVRIRSATTRLQPRNVFGIGGSDDTYQVGDYYVNAIETQHVLVTNAYDERLLINYSYNS